MNADGIVALIKKRRDDYRDKQLLAGPGSDPSMVEIAQRAWEFAEEYDSFLAEIKSASSANSQNMSNMP